LEKAIKYYQKAAELGSCKAFNNLGILYKNGKGFDKDTKKAEENYLKAIEIASNTEDEVGYIYENLGLLYENGK
jgi:TPR repeat protein